jgi:hypothetical protein
MADPIKFNCQCFNPAHHWVELSPQDTHRYRVECGTCCKFIKWGAEHDLHYRVASREKVTVTPYEDQIPHRRANLEDFF